MIFLNVWKKLVQQHKCRVVEGQEQFEQWRISAQSMTLFSVMFLHLRHTIQHETRQIARERGIHRSSVVWIIGDELCLKGIKKRHAQELTEANCITHLSRMKKLLVKFPESAIDFIFFTDEKVFTIAPPVNLQNNSVEYLHQTTPEFILPDLWLHQ